MILTVTFFYKVNFFFMVDIEEVKFTYIKKNYLKKSPFFDYVYF